MPQEQALAAGHADSAAPAVSAYPESHAKVGLWTLALGAIGVVYGDIGTSPLYAMRETIAAAAGHAGPVSRELVIGILSLLLWALVLTVTVKYVLILLEADNNGEGGSLTLVALAQRTLSRRSFPVLVMGMAGAGPLLWRRGDHPGDLRALRCRRAEARDACFRELCPADRPRHPDRRSSRSRAAARDGSPRSSVPSP